MPDKSVVALPISTLTRTGPSITRRTNKPLWILVVLALLGVAAISSKALTASKSSSSNVLTPGMQLAVGTLTLENTKESVSATQAAKLLPLWELLAQLQSSGAAAPQEITAVIEAIKLNMTANQISAIDSMPASDFDLWASSNSPISATTASSKSTSSAASNPMLGGNMGGVPMDGGGGPMPSGSSQQSTSSSKASASSSTSGPVQQVIQLLKSKVQSG